MDSIYNDTIYTLPSIFGSESIMLAPNLIAETTSHIMAGDCLTFKTLTVVLFLLYAFFTYYFTGYTKSCIYALFRPRILDKLMEEQSYIFDAFIKLLVINGIFTDRKSVV